jgi:hypothetical protein
MMPLLSSINLLATMQSINGITIENEEAFNAFY